MFWLRIFYLICQILIFSGNDEIPYIFQDEIHACSYNYELTVNSVSPKIFNYLVEFQVYKLQRLGFAIERKIYILNMYISCNCKRAASQAFLFLSLFKGLLSFSKAGHLHEQALSKI